MTKNSGPNAILIGEVEGDTEGEEMIFRKDEWGFRRTDGRYESL